ncbi:hypothetical protein M885DRAFT_508408 [Pelagophyceae sp. CCMP2097]|nr:hypothetical protein M885DRAFT_508408 [Pelagophyceae sp. CCMP2097]|mmetsp:Transcript_30183/g.104304  ORF Transcript_30183/g.104304 Transcript_30183/m.104304 type:complete len:375 (+) Transcript_30183:169-1293(+)
MWSAARCAFPGAASLVRRRAPVFSARSYVLHATSVAHNKRILNAKKAPKVLALFEEYHAEYNAVNVGTSVHQLAMFKKDGALWNARQENAATAGQRSEDPRLLRLAESLLVNVSHFEGRNLADAAWSSAVLRLDQTPAILQQVARRVLPKVDTLNPQDLARLAWSFARTGESAPELFDALALRAFTRVAKFKPREVSTILWAFATARHEAPGLFSVMTGFSDRFAVFEPHDTAQTLWAFAKVGHAAPHFFAEAAVHVTQKTIKYGSPDNLTKLAFAFSEVGIAAPQLFAAVEVEALKYVPMFRPQELADIVFAFAKARISAPALFEAVANEARKRVDTFSARDLDVTARAYASAGFEASRLLDTIRDAQGKPPK